MHTYSYTPTNQLTGYSSGGTSATLTYDPLGRLAQTAGSATTGLAYAGDQLIAEYSGSTLLRRYVPGPDGADDPIVWYEGSSTTDRRWLIDDERGSVIGITGAGGALMGAPNTYDEYGYPGGSNQGRFQYTGQLWIPEIGLYHYKARTYSPTIGRFMQTDPIGYGSDINMYAYARNDPVNGTDPSGMDPPISGDCQYYSCGANTSGVDDPPAYQLDQLNVTAQKKLFIPPSSWNSIGGSLVRSSFNTDFNSAQSSGFGGTPQNDNKKDCPVVPPAPPGANIHTNIKRAQFSLNPFWFYNQVRNHGPWDYKQQGSQYQDFGNFNYGATAYSFGFPAQVADRMAGWAQQQAGTSRPQWGDPLGSAPYGDDPNDQKMVNAGIKYRANGC